MSFVPQYFYFSSGKSLFVGEPPKSTSVFLGPGVDMIKEAMFVAGVALLCSAQSCTISAPSRVCVKFALIICWSSVRSLERCGVT